MRIVRDYLVHRRCLCRTNAQSSFILLTMEEKKSAAAAIAAVAAAAYYKPSISVAKYIEI